MFFFLMNIEQFHRLSQLVERKYEIKTPTTGGRFHLKNDSHFFFEVLAIKMYRDMKGILDTVGATLFLNKCPR